MEQKQSATEIARRTLSQLAKEGLPPTPENYEAIYNKITGKKVDPLSGPSQALLKALANADKKTATYIALEKKISAAIEKQNWGAVENELQMLLSSSAANTSMEINWALLIRALLRQLEISHKGTTLSRKKEGLSRVLTNFAKDPAVLAEKMQALMRSWGNETTEIEVQISNPNAAQHEQSNSAATTDLTAKDNDNTAAQLQDMLARTLDLALLPLLKDAPNTYKNAQDLLEQLRTQTAQQLTTESASQIKDILFTIETERENQQDIHQTLIDLLRLLTKSMASLAVEDSWLQGQLSIVNDVLSKPIDMTSLSNAVGSLKELVHKQSNLKPALHDAQCLIKKMAETFISRLVDMTETTDEYHQKIENHQHKLSGVNSIDELNGVLQNVLEDTRMIGLTVQRTREEFNDSKAKVSQAELKIQELTSVLEYINEVASEDYLTGTLNRRGMEEALEREFSRADRHHTALCIAMMDIDHFKKINDALGHSTGDEALAHFAKVIKNVKRATDVLARYGGEEFIIILPNTEQEDAIKVIERVQRKLTKEFFMHSDERVVITFSAGVAQRIGEETPDEIIPRGDAALYAAKNVGRNRVMAASTQQSALIRALQK
ncbi:MAG: GGDEF domain-containing protein [Betaproteobacteria bacterium]|nr:GGDEF domain-containing protein [Betaproteobacteria bacterium]